MWKILVIQNRSLKYPDFEIKLYYPIWHGIFVFSTRHPESNFRIWIFQAILYKLH